MTGGGVEIRHEPPRPGDYAGKEVSAQKIFNELGWQPRIGFEEGMTKTIAWFKSKYGNGKPAETLTLAAVV